MELSGKKAFVTGANGFIGSHLVEALLAKGFMVKALVRNDLPQGLGLLADIANLAAVDVVQGNILDPEFLLQATKDIDIIFNLAALISVPDSYLQPAAYIDTNIKGALYLCQAALANNVKKIVQISTGEVYGNAQYLPIDEAHPLHARSPYAATKIGAEQLVMSFYDAYKLPVVIARPFNTYGPRQSLKAVIPSVISRIVNGEKEIMVGDLSPTRDFSYVVDTCNAFIALAQSDTSIGEVFNVGSGSEISIGDTLETIKKIINQDVSFVIDENRIRSSEVKTSRVCCDNTKLKKLTKFQSQFTLEEGLVKTVAWFNDQVKSKNNKVELKNV